MTSNTLYVATGNAGKLRDFSMAATHEVAQDHEHIPWTIAALPGLAAIPSPEEMGETFHANARGKALFYAQFAPGEIVIADDSGLAVDALGGAPGVYSARFAQRLGFDTDTVADTDALNNTALLAQLAKLTEPFPHAARYLCVLVAVRDGAVLATAEGAVEGEILASPIGSGGFGYDPLFLIPAEDKTMSQLGAPARLALSHRGEALRRLLPQFARLLP
jgi:XTP/dITP diphosphohydrolase